MKLKRSTIIKSGIFLLGLIGVFFIVKNYQPQQAAIISQQQSKIASQLALTDNNQTAASSENQWQVFYNLNYTGLENFQVAHLAANENGQIAFLDLQKSQLLILDTASRSFQLLNLPAANATALAWSGEDLLVFASNILYLYQDKTQNWQALTPALNLPANVNLLQKFDQNYYLFGPNMIQKIILATNNEQKSQNWLNLDETAGQDLIDVWIDGAIWLSDANLGLRQYLRGAQVTTKIANDLLPPLYLTKKDDDFFVLSGSQGTITRFDAKGEAIQTWSDPILQDSRWLWFDPEENTLFVFKDNLLYNLKVN